MRQRFHSPKDYVPRTYCYRQAQPNTTKRLRLYCELRGLVPASEHVEPHSRRSTGLAFKRREGGAALMAAIQPGDHLVIASIDQIAGDRESFLFFVRWMFEHGIHLHLLEFLGTPLDCWSTAGRMVLDALLLNAELDVFHRQIIQSKRQREIVRYKSKPIPWFCVVEGGQLQLHHMAEEILIRVQRRRDADQLPWARISGLMYEEWEAATGLKMAKNQGKSKEAIDAYCFYKAWMEAGFPDLSETSPAGLKNKYRARIFPQEQEVSNDNA